MYIEFLHCNACFTYSSSSKESQIQFWLTECGHVACKACLNKNGEARQEGSSNVAEHTCPVCNTRCAAVELTDNLPPNLGAFFRSTHDMLDEAADVMRFQKTNTISLIEFLKDKLHKQKQMLDKAKNEILQYKDMKSELQNLKEENRRLKSQLQEARPSTQSTSVKRPIESPKLNDSPRKLHKSPTQNRDLDISPSQMHQPKTPNPPKRLTLPTSINSPMCPLIFKQQSQQKYDNYSSQHEYQNNNGLPYNNQLPWNYGVGHYDGYGGISDRYDARDMPSPSDKCYSLSFSESNFNQCPQKIFSTKFSRPATASSTRMTWNELRNSNCTSKRDVLKIDPGSRPLSASSASKYQKQSSSSYTIQTNFRPPLSMSRNFMVPQPPRTPITRNRDALPGLNNRGW
ncbi:RING finger protein 212B-like isoform X1 [Rhizophagus clarus]|uniref:RING finger protein 212B-like isoform X1 n=1 Tax=Rhizophagus clarus TaxID=94130 RepID=A0A8H3LBB9_9GLOM|nr:RING finger protein 212B-like isoform X1 [Rhizophagus clarus]